MRFSSTVLVLASLVVSSLSATVQDVLADIQTISTQLTNLDNSITSFPNTGGTLTQALAIHSNAVSLQSAIDKGTTDVQATPQPFSEADGRSVLDAVEALESTIDHALQQIVIKKPAFDALPLGGVSALVKQDLTNLSTSTAALEAALIAAAPPDLQAESTALKNRIDAAFATALAAYA